MEHFEDTSNVASTSDFMLEMMTDEKDGEEFTREYLKSTFLSSVGRSLYYARRQAGLTQAEVAERMNTTQSAIARFEADKNGSMSFRKYIDFAIACDMMPRSFVLHPVLEPITVLRNEMIAGFSIKPSQEFSNTERSDIIRTILSAQKQRAASLTGCIPLHIQEFKTAVETVQNATSQFHLPPVVKNTLTTSASPPTTTADRSTIDNQSTIDQSTIDQSTIGSKAGFVYA